MTKYKIVGALNILFSVPQLIMSFVYPVYVFPYMSSLYNNFNVEYKSNSLFVYVIILFALVMAILNIFVGLKEFGLQKEKYFNFSISLVVLSSLSMILLVGAMISVFILPVYNLNSQF